MLDELQHYIPSSGRLLWIMDEAATLPVSFISQYSERSTLLTNRFDIDQSCKKNNISCVLSDFELDESQTFACVIFPISKEKLLSNYIIASCFEWLDTSGTLILAGKKNEGIKSYFDKLCSNTPLKKHGHFYMGKVPREKCLNPEAIVSYRQASDIAQVGGYTMQSKPGIFGWQKIDEGSALLIETLKLAHTNLQDKSVMDLGCGSAYLALNAAAMGAASICASDNNATACVITRANFQNNNIVGEVALDDCAGTINKKFDIVLCNPPFHKGKATESDLTEKFVSASKRLLKHKGEAWFVVNAFIPLEKIAQCHFSKLETKSNNNRFKVLVFGN